MLEQKSEFLTGRLDVRIVDDIERPTLRDGQVRVEPAFVGICGTDLHEFMGGPKSAISSTHAHSEATLAIAKQTGVSWP